LAQIIGFATISVLTCIAALELYPAILPSPGEAHMRCAMGAIPIVQITTVAGKVASGPDFTFPFGRLPPTAHEYCSKYRNYASTQKRHSNKDLV
jgi:hypothetical protein